MNQHADMDDYQTESSKPNYAAYWVMIGTLAVLGFVMLSLLAIASGDFVVTF